MPIGVPIKYCVECKEEIPSGHLYCGWCGIKQGEICQRCGELIPFSEEYCKVSLIDTERMSSTGIPFFAEDFSTDDAGIQEEMLLYLKVCKSCEESWVPAVLKWYQEGIK